jgi:hypothetical protein
MSAPSPSEIELRAKNEAHRMLESAGRPDLATTEQDQMYVEVLVAAQREQSSLHPWWFRLRYLYAAYCVVAFLILMGLLCLSPADLNSRIPGWWSLCLLCSLLVVLFFVEILLTKRISSALKRTPEATTASGLHQQPGASGDAAFPWLFSNSPSLSRTFLFTTWVLAIVLLVGTSQLVLTRSLAASEPMGAASVVPAKGDASLAEPGGDDVGWYNTAVLASILIGFLLLSIVLIYAAVHLKVKLDYERERLKEHLPANKRWRWEFGHLLLLEIGIAIFVAFFITATLELILHRRVEEENKRHMRELEVLHRKHLEDTQRNLFNTLFGFNVNPRLGDEIFQTLQNAGNLYREDCSLMFEFDSLSDDERKRSGHDRKDLEELIAVHVTVSYKIRNTSPTSQRWKADPYFVNALALDDPADRFLVFKVEGCEDAEDCIKAGAVSAEDLRTKFTSKACRRQLDLGYITLGPKRTMQIHYTYRMVKRFTDSHSWLSVLAMDGIRIHAGSVDPRLGLDFEIESAHRKDVALVGDSRGTSSRFWEWRIEDPFLPNQGIILHWHRTQPMAQSAKPGEKAVEHTPANKG